MKTTFDMPLPFVGVNTGDTVSIQTGVEHEAVMPRPTPAERLAFLFLVFFNLFVQVACASFETFLLLFKALPPWFLDWAGRFRARAAFYRAARNVPAYADFLAIMRWQGGNPPETDKETFIKRYPTEQRCVGGAIPESQVAIDESSGSTGTPYNWVRTARERHQSHIFISYFAKYCYGSQPYVTINAFSMGAWATGINMGVAMGRNGIVKNTGPDIGKILHTMRFFGPRYRYLIAGYPPFLKHLVDAAEAEGFPFDEFELRALVGGEGMSEGLRDYLLGRFRTVYSGFGATDLEIGIAGETPLAVAIRRLCRDRADVREKLFGDDSRLPMVFQYNPLMHYIEVNENRELVFTISRKSLLSPRIRYNVHDEGGVARFDEMEKMLAEAGVDVEALKKSSGSGRLRLPFLWVYGRRDYTVSLMGANIYPEDLEQSLYAEPHLSKITRSFCLSLAESEDASVRPRFIFEVDAEPTEELRATYRDAMLRRLVALNADFREAWREYPETLVPEIQLYRVGEGPFAGDKGKIKQTRILAAS
ncbi:MAG: phenylacetate--CoA ligase family protein [Ignavibacteriales bacterium]|nr:phenylacetate--CoA ligase family protein [Ignavibacteriales bacterium]